MRRDIQYLPHICRRDWKTSAIPRVQVILSLSSMLPTYHHRSPPTLGHLSGIKSGRNFLSRFLKRWVLLGCMFLVAIWFTKPLLEDFLWPSLNMSPPGLSLEEQKMWNARKIEVREAFKHAWDGYSTQAFPSDELDSVSGGKSDRSDFIYSFQILLLILLSLW